MVEVNQDPSSAAVTGHDSGKAATIHDFLSLSGTAINTTSPILTVAKNESISGSQIISDVTTQDFLQPLQKHMMPTANKGLNLLPNGFGLSAGNTQNNTADYNCRQQIPYALVNGALEITPNRQSKYRSPNASFLSKFHATHGMPLNKHWQKRGLEMADGNKRIRTLSEDEDEDEEESMDLYGYNSRKEEHFRKQVSADPAQQEGRHMEGNSKGMTLRSKHSATEQRRRSKINDRFQMLRQMLPNADQKRDKASFLLEVIQYIQMLHEKIKKYEAEEQGLSQQERTKLISWDKNSGNQEITLNNSYIPLVSTLSYNSREVSDSSGCAQKSPFTSASEHTVSRSDSMSNNASNYDNKSLVNKPTLVTIHQPQSMASTSQQANSFPMFHATNSNMFGNGRYHDELKAKSSLLGLHPSNNLASQTSSYALDHEHEKFKNSENNIAVSNHWRSDNELEDGKRSNTQFLELYHIDTIKKSAKDDCSSAHVSNEFEDRKEASWHRHDNMKGEQITENVQDPPVVLGGVINISSAYSQGLLNTLTKALQSSGLDLGQATISVQIDLGKSHETTVSNLSKTTSHELPTSQSKETSSSENLGEPRKRPKFEVDT